MGNRSGRRSTYDLRIDPNSARTQHKDESKQNAPSDSSWTSIEEKCYDPDDPSLTIVDREDEMDFLCEGFESPRALMSCGHAVTPTSLTNWCHRLLDEGRSRFVCGQTDCNAEWSYEEVCKMALLTPEEQKHFEETMKSNAANTKPCLREWRGPAPRSDRCDNDVCNNESVKTLQMCPEITLNSVWFPSIRACPTCGMLLQHNNKNCKNASCPRCKVYFCFVCLKAGYHGQCSGAASRQTSIPVWKKN